MTSAERAELVRDAGRRIARGSQSFYLASRLFDRTTRERVWLLYSWCRACDDIADGQSLGHDGAALADPGAAQRGLVELTDTALRGGQTGRGPFDGLGLLAAECALPPDFVRDHLDGFALDSQAWRPQTLEDLLRYCYHVAGVVGRMMALVMGVNPEDDDVLDRASDLGIAFQLANIARDVAEDQAMGRCYLPADWLAKRGIEPSQLMDERHRPALVEMIAELIALAGRYEQSARLGAYALPFRSRWAVLAAADIYGGLGRAVRDQGRRAWDRRVTIGKRQKLAWLLGSWFAARGQAANAVEREGLWTRPRPAAGQSSSGV